MRANNPAGGLCPRTNVPRGVGGRRAGFGLVEILIATLIVSLALVGFADTIFQGQILETLAREEAIALNAARQQMERLYGESADPISFSRIFARYNSSGTDDPGGAGTAPGPAFAVAGLSLPSGASYAGSIEFPANDAAPDVLREDLPDAKFGTPMDLNGDGVIDSASHSGDYKVLPVRIRVTWRSGKAIRNVALQAWIAEEKS